MFYVEVERYSPYNECLEYSFQTFDEAYDYAEETAKLQGVTRTLVYGEEYNIIKIFEYQEKILCGKKNFSKVIYKH